MPVKAFSKYKRHVEMVYVSEWAITFHPEAFLMLNQPLGPLPERVGEVVVPEEERAMLSALRPRCDAVIVKPTEVLVVEAKILPQRYPTGLGDLLFYRELAPDTPELAEHRHKLWRYVLLTPLEAPKIRTQAEKLGIEYVVWMPPITAEYLKPLYPYLREVPRYLRRA